MAHRGYPRGSPAAGSALARRSTRSFPSLGAAAWPELKGYQGYERERRAMELVRAEFVSFFSYYERLFLFGQSLLYGDPLEPNSDSDECDAIRRALRYFQDAIQRTGSFTLDQSILESMPRDPDLWRRAGGIDLSKVGTLGSRARGGYRKNKARCAYRSAFGPTPPAMISALGILLCDTGWNLQPARDLGRNPYAFRSAKDVYVAKNPSLRDSQVRAGHHVVGYLGEVSALDDGRLTTAVDHWNHAVEVYDPDRHGDGYARLSRVAVSENDVTAADILDRYGRMAEALRSEFGCYAEDLFGNWFLDLLHQQ